MRVYTRGSDQQNRKEERTLYKMRIIMCVVLLNV
jgi:hypothetical protein